MHSYHFPPVANSTPWAPAWSPDGRWIAVSMHGSLWRVDPATGAATELVTGPKYYSTPDWSPDGKWLVYTADDGGKTIQLEILNLESGETRALTSDDQNYVDPRFSPDGTKIAYTASKPAGWFNVFIRPIAAGAWTGDEVQTTRDSNSGIDRPYFTAQDMSIEPAWLRNGRELLILANRGAKGGSGNVVRIPAAGFDSLATRAVLLEEQTLYQTRPEVSPDGSRFVFVSARGGRAPWNNLYTRAMDGSDERRLTSDSADAFNPRWSPDGRSIAFLSNARGLPHLAIIDVASGRVREVVITSRTWKRPMGTLRVRVNDASRRQPTAARVHLTAADAKFYAPASAFARWTWATDRAFQTTGAFEVELPVGQVTLDVMKGFEFSPQHRTADIRSGQVTDLDIDLPRIASMANDGWCSGSTGTHIHGGGPLRYDLSALLQSAAAEDVTVVNVPFAHNDGREPVGMLWRPGTASSPSDRPFLVVGQEHRPPFYGHVAAFGMRAWLETLFPVTIGYEAAYPPTLAPSNADILERARKDGAITAYVHAFSGEADPMSAQALGLGKALIPDAALGLVDAIEWAAAGRGPFVPWYALLNNGIRVTAIGGEDTIDNLPIMRQVGSVRTYARCGGPASADAFWNSVRRGSAFVSTGPLVDLRVNDKSAGDTVHLAAAGNVTLKGWVKSVTPLQKISVIFNGAEVAEIPLDSARTSAAFSTTLRVTKSGWYHLRAEGSARERYPLDALYAQAFTNPIWISVGGRPVRDRASADYALKWIDMLQIMADAWPGWDSTTEKAHVFAQFDRARAVYRRLAREASPPPAAPSRRP